MDILKNIDSYCDLKIKSDKLKNKIRVLANPYRKSGEEEKKNISEARDALAKVEEPLRQLHSKIFDEVKSFDSNALNEIISAILEKKAGLQDQIKVLNQKREDAVFEAKEARINMEVNGDFSFAGFEDRYKAEILDVESKIKSYQYFIDNMQYRINDLDQESHIVM